MTAQPGECPPGYMDSEEAAGVLGFSVSQFNRLVADGTYAFESVPTIKGSKGKCHRRDLVEAAKAEIDAAPRTPLNEHRERVLLNVLENSSREALLAVELASRASERVTRLLERLANPA